MNRVEEYIAQVEAQKRNRRLRLPGLPAWKSGKARFAAAYFALMFLFVALVEAVGERLSFLAILIQMPMMPLTVVPIFGLALAAIRRNLLGAILNLGSIGLAVYMINPVLMKGPILPKSPTFTAMTMNLQHLQKGDTNALFAIRELSADVILLQEAGELKTNYDFRRQALEGYNIYVSEEIAIASRYPVDELREVNFHNLLDFERNKDVFGPNPADHGTAQIAKIKWSGQHIYVVNTHLAPNAYARNRPSGLGMMDLISRNVRYRMAQARALSKEIAKLEGPVIFGGDFNNPPIGQCYSVLKQGLADPWRSVGQGTGWTIDSRKPFKRIDYLLHSDHWNALKAELGSEIGSDHKALRVTFEMVRPGRLDERPIPTQDYIVPMPDEMKGQPKVASIPGPGVASPKVPTGMNSSSIEEKPVVRPTPSTKPAVTKAPVKKPVAKPPAKPVVKKSVTKAPVKKKPVRRSNRRRR